MLRFVFCIFTINTFYSLTRTTFPGEFYFLLKNNKKHYWLCIKCWLRISRSWEKPLTLSITDLGISRVPAKASSFSCLLKIFLNFFILFISSFRLETTRHYEAPKRILLNPCISAPELFTVCYFLCWFFFWQLSPGI